MQTVKQSLTIIPIILIVLLYTIIFNVPLVMAENETQTVTEVMTTDSATDPATDQSQVLDENGQAVDPGILPDSPFYWWDQLMSKIQLALAWTPEQQAEVLQEQALENMAEAVVMTEEGQPEDAEIAMNKYMETVAEVENLIGTLSDPSSQEAQNLLTAISVKNASNIQVLGNLILSEKLPPQAAEQIFINAVKKITKCMDKLDRQTQIQLKKELKRTTEELGDVDLDEETEITLEEQEEQENVDQTDQTEQTSETNTDVDEDQVDSTTNVDVNIKNNKNENIQDTETEQDSNRGQTNKEQKEEKDHNITDNVNEDGQGNEVQNEDNYEDNNGSGKNHDGGKGKNIKN